MDWIQLERIGSALVPWVVVLGGLAAVLRLLVGIWQHLTRAWPILRLETPRHVGTLDVGTVRLRTRLLNDGGGSAYDVRVMAKVDRGASLGEMANLSVFVDENILGATPETARPAELTLRAGEQTRLAIEGEASFFEPFSHRLADSEALPWAWGYQTRSLVVTITYPRPGFFHRRFSRRFRWRDGESKMHRVRRPWPLMRLWYAARRVFYRILRRLRFGPQEDAEDRND